jgi:hypothetical protein
MGVSLWTDHAGVQAAPAWSADGLQIVKKRQRRLTGVDEIVLSLYAKGLTTGEISAYFAEIYGASVSRETISRITDKVIEEMQSRQNRPLDQIYAAGQFWLRPEHRHVSQAVPAQRHRDRQIRDDLPWAVHGPGGPPPFQRRVQAAVQAGDPQRPGEQQAAVCRAKTRVSALTWCFA